MVVVKSINPFSAVTQEYVVRLAKDEEGATDEQIAKFCGEPRFGYSVVRRRNKAGVMYAKASLYMD